MTLDTISDLKNKGQKDVLLVVMNLDAIILSVSFLKNGKDTAIYSSYPNELVVLADFKKNFMNLKMKISRENIVNYLPSETIVKSNEKLFTK